MKTPVVFMGSPEFSLPTLHALTERYQVCGVVTQPDRPSGRGKQLTSSPVKQVAMQLGLPVMQPQKLRDPQAFETLRQWEPDIIVVAAFGQILRQEVLELPRYGCINVHASLLPRWRGAAPIQAAILAGDAQTGISIMKMDAGLDSGPVLSQCAVAINPEDTAGSLNQKLAAMGASLLIETLPGYIEGDIHPQSQDEAFVTKAPMLSRQQGELDFNQPAQYLARMVRAYHPWPGCYTIWKGQSLKVHRAHAIQTEHPEPGSRLIMDGKPAWITSSGILVADELQPAGKRAMLGEEFLRGNRDWAGG
ncbi:MAG: methionyl-tRNA formyltransferase [Anaerolineaceae bacterium]|nr:methionyl-tRNA formyltransferase [Anaerolineaceae bacterium]MBN2676476.1 methionyl-tRNA formyltransferase [Anaerolineaceae bacterium]